MGPSLWAQARGAVFALAFHAVEPSPRGGVRSPWRVLGIPDGPTVDFA
jgi:hypothetical protein